MWWFKIPQNNQVEAPKLPSNYTTKDPIFKKSHRASDISKYSPKIKRKYFSVLT